MLKTLAGLLVLAIGCGGGGAEGTQSTTAGAEGGSAAAASSAGGDASIEVKPIAIAGVLFEPGALGRPDMQLVDSKRPTTLDRQRKVFEGTKEPVQKQAQAAILATMLYRQWKAAQDQTQLLTDARQALTDAATAAGDKPDDITLRLLGTYDLMLEDFPAAEQAWGKLVAQAPKDKEAAYNRAWWAYSLLREYKNAEALAAVKDQPLDPKQPELAYVTAWAKFRAGDNAGAWQAILVAAGGWGQNGNVDQLNRDILLFAGRTGVSLPDAISALGPIYKAKDQQYAIFAKLGLEAYQYSGRWADGVAAIDRAIATEGSSIPPNDLPILRYSQADYTVRLDDPVKAAMFAKQALDALPACGAKCSDKDKENVVESVYVMGRLFHLMYATAHDDRYYQPAHDLYAQSIPLITMNDDARTQATKDSTNLEGSFKTMRPTKGMYSQDLVGVLLSRHNQEVQACYERALESNAKLTGTLAVNLEADQSGAITGASTQPPAGAQDIAQVASCVTERAKKWRLPTRGNGKIAGVTRIKLTYNLAPKAK